MIVYRFMSAKWAKVAVDDKCLRLSIFSELNDPFELSGFNLRDPAMNRYQYPRHFPTSLGTAVQILPEKAHRCNYGA